MEERHLHFNITSALFTLLVVIVGINVAKFAANRWPVPGLSQLINNV